MGARENQREVPVIVLDEVSPLPKYQQIVEQVKDHIAHGRLAPGAPLPSVRQLAGDLGINVNTAIAAYRVLEAEQVIVLRRGARATVHPRLAAPAAPRADDIARVRADLERAHTAALLLGMDAPAVRALVDEVFGAETSGGAA
jgi:GntR family transcriptional regulator